MRRLLNLLAFAFLLNFLIFFKISSAEIASEKELNQFITHYYENPQPNQIPQALKYFIASDLPRYMQTNQHLVDMIAYFFARVAENNPKLLRNYEKIYDKVEPQGQLFLRKIFFVYRDGKAEKFLKSKINDKNPQSQSIQALLNQPLKGKNFFIKDVDSLGQLDFLWIEFFVSGDTGAIKKTINVLAWKDIFQSKLLDWMLASHSPEEKNTLSTILRNHLRADVNLEQTKINYIGDMDFLFASFLRPSAVQKQNAQIGTELRKILGISDKDFAYISIKGAALSGLWVNAEKHPKVLELCQTELAARKDKKSSTELQNIINATIAKKDTNAHKR